MRMFLVVLPVVCLCVAACHNKTATVLPKGDSTYEVIGQAATEQDAYMRAESEGKYTCKQVDKEMIVVDQKSVFQGADKSKKDQVGAANVALAFVTGRSGKERDADDYKVTLAIACK